LESGGGIKNIVTIVTTVTESLGGVQGDLFKGQPCWGAVRRRRGKAPNHPVGRNALLMRSVKSAFALLLTKVTKPRLTPD